jgi:hypothetical protein
MKRGSLCYCLLDAVVDHLEGIAGDDRTDDRLVIQRVTRGERLGACGKLGEELIVDLALNNDAAGIQAVEKEMVEPVSRASICAISSRRLLVISAAFKKSRALSAGVDSAQAGKALAAASTAARASERDADATVAKVLPLYGSWTSKVLLPSASFH